MQQLLAVGGEGGFIVDPKADQKHELRITENPLLKRNAATMDHTDITPTQHHIVVRNDTPTPVVGSARGRHGCWSWKKKANSATRRSLERSVVVVTLLLIAGLGFLIFGFLFQLKCNDGKKCQNGRRLFKCRHYK
jgi:hypothetical protein